MLLMKILPALGITVALVLPAAATTIGNVAGVYDESAKARSNGPITATQLRDFDETGGDPLLEIVGNTHIFGFVAHRANFSGSRFTDKWAMDFGTDTYNVVFRWDAFANYNVPVEFDGRFGMNNVYTDLGTNGVLKLGNLTGLVSFDLDPIHGNFRSTKDERAVWDIKAEKVSAIPLPAGAVLLMTGLAGLAFARRRRT
ncbi:hypothetical protein ROLI_011000 [Roseobacter fucihabitans]|uniref:VPLPA-CTERM sorting domain-containing protein n=1 Tax=Roseobacter fucihabitans TaxID=1537242 RepID=A0ABZ2BPU7_9RHOB|nr:VPLPA-CTERM sorting domain-containing protein [Roseobacter litoralis]MBC6967136.1 hypothetical protein [Roseobacter litoralis]